MHHTDSQFRRTLGRLLPLVLVLAALALTGCMDKVVEALAGDAAPSIDGSEESAAKAQVVAQFDQDAGRVALPNDAVLVALNEQLAALGKTELTGTARNMPIRIPFSGAISYPFADGTADPTLLDSAAVTAWASSVFLLDLGTASAPNATPTPIPALPYYVTGGSFKAVYLDANNDLVLVPGGSLLSNGHIYAVVVTRGVTDSNGNAIQASPAMVLVRQTEPLIDSENRSVSSLVDDSEAQALEQLRQGYKPILDALAANDPPLPRENVALLFTFTVEETDSTSPTTGSAALIAGIEAGGGASAPADLQWFTNVNTSDSDPDQANAADYKAFIASQFPTAPLDNVAAIYRGHYTCLDFLDKTSDGDFEIDTSATPAMDCPNATAGVADGEIEFWLAKPAGTLTGIAVFQHGITRSSLDFVAIADALAQAGIATIAIDLWDHGTRLYTFADGTTEVPFVRPDDPSRTVGYLLQSRLDTTRIAAIAKTNSGISARLGNTPANLYFVGQSLGAIVGAEVATNSAGVTFDAMVLNVPGGDLADIVLNGDIGDVLIPLVAADQGLAVGSPELNATLLGIEMAARHALFAGLADPMALYDPESPPSTPPLLFQEMTGDTTIANSDAELLNRMMKLPTYTDGDGDTTATSVTRARWIFVPGSYTETVPGSGATAGHGFLLDGLTSATAQGQKQAVTFFGSTALGGTTIIDPSVVTP